MEWLNYHHLLYFYTVAREGSIARASEVLRLAQPTLSGQIRTLEQALGEKLFARQGRGLVMTESGRLVYGYADEIFSLGREMLETLRGRPSARGARLHVGISDVVPKLVSHQILETALALDPPVRIVCREGTTEELMAGLAVQAFDLLLTDAPLAPGAPVRAFNHLLGECGITFLARSALAERHRRGFPQSLDDAPMLLPTSNAALRRALDQWFEELGVRPRPVAEIEDSALLKVFGQNGAGIFPVPSILAKELAQRHALRVVGRTDAVKERFYAISVERRIKNAAVAAITERARERLFPELVAPARTRRAPRSRRTVPRRSIR
ncbi:MAG: transcriptional activator NhaR [Myxococcota bacterium]